MTQEDLKWKIVDVCKTIMDPEIPHSIIDLGLIYSIDVHEDFTVDVQMTLTTPSCGFGPEFLNLVHSRINGLEEVKEARVELVWDPPWNQSMIKEEIQFEMGLW
tara:strand:+ start:1305 stop:1616 length:312 start_codon:yes stop_codon:yes gene_type:complete